MWWSWISSVRFNCFILVEGSAAFSDFTDSVLLFLCYLMVGRMHKASSHLSLLQFKTFVSIIVLGRKKCI